MVNLNFLEPRKMIENGYNEANLGLSVFFVFLPFFFMVLIGLMYGFPFDLITVFLSGLNYFVSWLINGIILFVLIYVLKGKNAKFNLQGVLFNLSLIQVVSTIILIITFIGLLLMSPTIFNDLAKISNTAVTADDAVEMLSQINFLNTEISLIVLFLIIGLGGVLGIYSIYLLYLIVSVTKKDWIAKNIVILLIFGGISVLFISLLPF